MTDGAVRAVAPDEPGGRHGFLAPVGVPEDGLDAVIALREGDASSTCRSTLTP